MARVLTCALLVAWQPLGFALTAPGAIVAMQVRGPAVGVILALKLIVAGAGFGAGMALLNRREGSDLLACWALAAAIALDTFVYLTPWFPSNRMPGDTPLYIAATWSVYGGLLVYVLRSRRAPRP